MKLIVVSAPTGRCEDYVHPINQNVPIASATSLLLSVRASRVVRNKSFPDDDQNFTTGGFSEPSFAANSAIGWLPEKAVFAQSTVGNVRSDRL